jgi:hypothetical protein
MMPNLDEVAYVRRIRLDHIGQENAVEFAPVPESERPITRLRMGDRDVHAPRSSTSCASWAPAASPALTSSNSRSSPGGERGGVNGEFQRRS